MQDCWSFTCCLSWILGSSSRCNQFNSFLSNQGSLRFLKYVWPFYNIMHERVKSCFNIQSIFEGKWKFLSVFTKGKHVAMRSSSIDSSEIEDCINEFDNFIDVYTLCIKRASFQTEDDVLPMEPFITTKAHIFLHDVLLANKKYYQEKSNSKSPVKCFLQVTLLFWFPKLYGFFKDPDNQ